MPLFSSTLWTVSHATIWIDVSAAINYRRSRVHGVTRFVLETAQQLAAHPEIHFFRSDPFSIRLVEVTRNEIDTKYTLLTKFPTEETRSLDTARIKSRVLRYLRFRPHMEHLVRIVVSTATEFFSGFRRLTFALRRVPSRFLARSMGRVPSASSSLENSWSRDDVICHLGFWTERSDLRTIELISRRRAQVGLKVVRFMHDIIPVSQPQFTGDPMKPTLALLKVLEHTDFLLTNSRYTAADIGTYHSRIGQTPLPSRVVRMASLVAIQPTRRPEGFDVETPFVLCVGTIEIRKNHHLLFDVWESFVADLPHDQVPILVLAGSLGWLNTETTSRLRWTPGFESAVRFIENPTDAELSWLYANCLFTVYPSLFEGWGYPITESLDAGKVCVTSNVSSMPEAAKGLGILLDPRDRCAWRETIERLVKNPDELRALEDAIRHRHVRLTPADVADDIWNSLSMLWVNTTGPENLRPNAPAGETQ